MSNVLTIRYTIPVLLAALAVLAAGTSLAQNRSTAELQRDFTAEAGALDAKIGQYFDARERENEALAELARASRQLDDTLGNPLSGPAELIDLEAEVTVARERACGLTEETAARRRAMYDSMKRLAAKVRELERRAGDRQNRGIGGAGGGIAGSWQIEAQPNDLWGFLDLKREGTLVSGSYRLSNGAEGSLQGTFAGGRLELELVDSERGAVGDIEGELEAEAGEIRGTWHARELAGGRPGAGEWTARRVE